MSKSKAAKDKIKQTALEREQAAIGSESSIIGKSGNKSMGAQRSFTSKQRTDLKQQARIAFNNGEITKAEYTNIVKKVDDANAVEFKRFQNKLEEAARSRSMKDKVSLKEALPPSKTAEEINPPKKRASDMSKSELEAVIKEQESKAKTPSRKLKRGGKVTPFNKGGMPSRKGNFDMRKGGMFMGGSK